VELAETGLRQHRCMTKMSGRPKTVTVFYRGIPYVLDLVRCRRALVDRQVDGGLDSMESLAEAVGISRSTASRFFSGKPTSLTVTLKILEVLKLRFDAVARPKGDEDDADSSGSGVTAKLPTERPSGGPGSSAIRIHPTGT
jgi:transcriptional regulator with XRE-family HTH domain